MMLATTVRTRSTCVRRQVGCVVVNDRNRVLSTGYNGSLPGAPHCYDVGCDMVAGSCVRTVHAEENAIGDLPARARAGSRIYTTDFPCPKCVDLLIHSGLGEVIWMIPYWKGMKEALPKFADAGIVVRNYVPDLLLTPG